MKDKLETIAYYAGAMLLNVVTLMAPFLILMFIIEMING